MAEDEARRITAQDEAEDIEAHRRRITADDETESTEDDDDEVEAHGSRRVQQRRIT